MRQQILRQQQGQQQQQYARATQEQAHQDMLIRAQVQRLGSYTPRERMHLSQNTGSCIETPARIGSARR